MARDVLRLRNMVFHAYHGTLVEERRLGQKFEVDVEIITDTREAGSTDDLTKTVDYIRVYEQVERVIMEESLQLIESLAERIARMVLDGFAVSEVLVRVRKPSPPIRGHLECVELEIRRTRTA